MMKKSIQAGKKLWRRCTALLLSVFLITALIPPIPARADIEGFDYSRVAAYMTSKPYPVTFAFGGMQFTGRLQCKSPLDKKQIDDAVNEVLKATGLTMKKIRQAQETYDKAIAASGLTREDYDNMIANILSISTLGIGPVGFDAIYSAISSAERLINDPSYSLSQFLKGLGMSGVDAGVQTGVDWLLQEKILKMDAEEFEALFKWGTPKAKINVFWMVVQGIKISGQEYAKDQARWKLRIDGVKAGYLLEAFYQAVDKALDKLTANEGTWRLTVNSERSRYFTFYGVEGNKQTWHVVIDAYNGGGSPLAGTYKGYAAITASHNMYPFDVRFWDMGLGMFHAGWLADVMSVGVYDVYMSGGTSIRRSLIDNDFTFTISQSDWIGHFLLGSRRGSKIYEFDLGKFTDDTSVQCTQDLVVTGGIAMQQEGIEGVVGYAGADIHMVVNATESNLEVIGEKMVGMAGVALFLEPIEVDESGTHIANVWDYTIWKPLESGKAQLRIGNAY